MGGVTQKGPKWPESLPLYYKFWNLKFIYLHELLWYNYSNICNYYIISYHIISYHIISYHIIIWFRISEKGPNRLGKMGEIGEVVFTARETYPLYPWQTMHFWKEDNLFFPKMYSFPCVLLRHSSGIDWYLPYFPSTLGPFSLIRNHMMGVSYACPSFFWYDTDSRL